MVDSTSPLRPPATSATQTLVAGIDSSTQSTKVVIVDLVSGAIMRSGAADHPSGTSVDPETWWHALQQAVAAAGGFEDVAAISVAGQQHGMIALDETGRVVREALLWNDTRSAAAAAQLRDEFGDVELATRTGCVPVASFTATKLRWLRDAEPENAAKVAAVALPHDWLTWRLRGFGPDHPDLEELVTDRSDASGTNYFNSVVGEYDREVLIQAFGRDLVLPRILRADESAGVTATSPEIPAGLLIGPGAGDNAGAALGLGATEGTAVVSIGTSGTVFAVTPQAIADPTGTVAGFADASGRFLPLIATLNAARVLDATAALLSVNHQELGQLALQADPGSAGLVLQPYFEGERTPNLPDATATLFGMSLNSFSRENLARAAIEGLLCGLADGLAAIQSHGVEVDVIQLIGGAAQNEAVQQIAAQVFDVPVSVPAPREYVAMGAAVQAGWVLSGKRPMWPQPTVELPRATDPRIREQYDAHKIS